VPLRLVSTSALSVSRSDMQRSFATAMPGANAPAKSDLGVIPQEHADNILDNGPALLRFLQQERSVRCAITECEGSSICFSDIILAKMAFMDGKLEQSALGAGHPERRGFLIEPHFDSPRQT